MEGLRESVMFFPGHFRRCTFLVCARGDAFWIARERARRSLAALNWPPLPRSREDGAEQGSAATFRDPRKWACGPALGCQNTLRHSYVVISPGGESGASPAIESFNGIFSGSSGFPAVTSLF
jgi:hypothetical protein